MPNSSRSLFSPGKWRSLSHPSPTGLRFQCTKIIDPMESWGGHCRGFPGVPRGSDHCNLQLPESELISEVTKSCPCWISIDAFFAVKMPIQKKWCPFIPFQNTHYFGGRWVVENSHLADVEGIGDASPWWPQAQGNLVDGFKGCLKILTVKYLLLTGEKGENDKIIWTKPPILVHRYIQSVNNVANIGQTPSGHPSLHFTCIE